MLMCFQLFWIQTFASVKNIAQYIRIWCGDLSPDNHKDENDVKKDNQGDKDEDKNEDEEDDEGDEDKKEKENEEEKTENEVEDEDEDNKNKSEPAQEKCSNDNDDQFHHFPLCTRLKIENNLFQAFQLSFTFPFPL